jgi:hypothetical protein
VHPFERGGDFELFSLKRFSEEEKDKTVFIV